MIGNEREILFVGYGAMLTEGFVAIMALIAACTMMPGDYLRLTPPMTLIRLCWLRTRILQ